MDSLMKLELWLTDGWHTFSVVRRKTEEENGVISLDDLIGSVIFYRRNESDRLKIIQPPTRVIGGTVMSNDLKYIEFKPNGDVLYMEDIGPKKDDKNDAFWLFLNKSIKSVCGPTDNVDEEISEIEYEINLSAWNINSSYGVPCVDGSRDYLDINIYISLGEEYFSLRWYEETIVESENSPYKSEEIRSTHLYPFSYKGIELARRELVSLVDEMIEKVKINGEGEIVWS